MSLIQTKIPSRVNDSFIKTNRINATPVDKNITHPLVDSGPNTLSTRYMADFYSSIALDIVAETIFKYPYPFVSEKTLRPINCKRMFIIVGAPRTLELLHSKGFLTFGDIIDESYDLIDDPEERFLAIISAVEKFCALDLEVIKNYYRENQWKFEHNWQTMKKLKELEIDQFRKGLSVNV